MKSNKFIVEVQSDEAYVPEKIQWESPEIFEKGECKSIAIAMWDPKQPGTMRLDIWTKDITTDEMKKFFLQNIITLCDTYERATSDSTLSEKVKQFILEIIHQEKIL